MSTNGNEPKTAKESIDEHEKDALRRGKERFRRKYHDSGMCKAINTPRLSNNARKIEKLVCNFHGITKKHFKKLSTEKRKDLFNMYIDNIKNKGESK